jgi:hypothetical protein
LANNETFTGSFTINSSLKSTGRCFLRWQFLITQIIFPNDSSIENLSSFSFYNLNITSLRIPNSVVRIGRTLLSNGGAKSVYPMTTLFIDVNYFISLNIYDVLPSAQ